MTIYYDKDLKALSALNHAFSMAWAGISHRVVTAYVGEPPYHLGTIEFRREKDLPDRITLAAKKAGVAPHAYQGLISPAFTYLAFRQGGDYLNLMSEIQGKQIVSGSDLVVQVTGRDKFWHEAADSKHISFANMRLTQAHQPGIRIDKKDENRTDYIFPTMASMKEFCTFIERGNLDMIAAANRKQAALLAPSPTKI